jgi:hypothetical protein
MNIKRYLFLSLYGIIDTFAFLSIFAYFFYIVIGPKLPNSIAIIYILLLFLSYVMIAYNNYKKTQMNFFVSLLFVSLPIILFYGVAFLPYWLGYFIH